MSRFREPQHPDFQRLNASIGFDRRLWPQDIAQSRAHARMLAERGIITAEDRDSCSPASTPSRASCARAASRSSDADEDIHMAIERRLTELAGPVGGKLHTARSRNDQVATDLAMFMRERAAAAQSAIAGLMGALLARAEEHLDWPMPGYTHLQRAQPVYLGHHLLAYFWMLERDRARFAFAERQAGRCRSARARWRASTSTPTAGRWRASSASRSVSPTRSTRSPAATSSLDYLSAAATCATHLSRLGAELVLWSSWSSASASCPTRGARAPRSCRRRRTPTRPSCCAPRRRASSATWRPSTASCTPCH